MFTPSRSGALLGLVLVACGGAPPPRAPEAGAEPGAAPAAAPASAPAAATEAAPAGGAPAASPGGAPDEKAPAGTEPGASHEFKTVDTHTAKETHGVEASKLAPTKTEALLKLVVVDKDKGPIPGIVVSLTGADGKKFYTQETDATGYAEVLVPIGQKYDIVYLSLGHQDIAATTAVENKANFTMKLTLRFKGFVAPKSEKGGAEHFVLDGVNFDTGKATIRPDSFARLDSVVEYMSRKKSVRIEISGHTDNVGNAKNNKALSQKRADACRDYVVKKGIDGSRVQAVGYGDERPAAPNDTEEGRQKNRRIEATEL
jgi:outer membrane protein OmpA-like peptidoglycan-associated protein